jgi:hypothetical protein
MNMGVGLLPWDKWLPPYIFGPVLSLGVISLLVFASGLHWWDYALLSGSAAIGTWATWAWFKHGKNVFKREEVGTSAVVSYDHSESRSEDA